MEYFLAILVLIGLSVSVTTLLTGIFGSYVIIVYIFLGFVMGVDSFIIGVGGVIGNIINIVQTNKYVKSQGTISQAPNNSRLSSIGYIIAFVITLIILKGFNIDLVEIKYWYYLPVALFIWFIIRTFTVKKNQNKLNDFALSIIKYKIVEKYDSDPKWATYLYFREGNEGWNNAIYGSFRARDPQNDLTFVFNDKEDAKLYAERTFIDAEYIE